MRSSTFMLSALAVIASWSAAALFAQGLVPGDQIYVTSNTDLRSGATAIGKVTAGNILTVEEVYPGWYRVHHKAYAVHGWIPQAAAVPVQEALDRFTAQIQARPTASAYVDRAIIWKSRGELALAGRDLDMALSLEPQNPYALHTRGVVELRQKQWPQAIHDFDDVLRLSSDPDLKGSAYHNRGIAHLRLHDFERAIADFDACLQLDRPNSADAFAHRGEARNFVNGNLDMALADLNEALRQNPKHERAWSMRAANYQLRGDWDRARADYDQALLLNSENAEALENRGVVWEKTGDLDRAITDFSTAMRVDPKSASPFRHRAQAFERRGDFEKAEVDLNELVRLSQNGERVSAFVTRAGFYARREQVAQAQPDVAQALQIVDHTQPEQLSEIAWFLATCPKSELRQGALALQLAKEACELSQYSKPAMLDTLAAAYAESGDFDKAVETDTKAMSLAGDAKQKEAIQVRMENYLHSKPFRDEL